MLISILVNQLICIWIHIWLTELVIEWIINWSLPYSINWVGNWLIGSTVDNWIGIQLIRLVIE